MTDQPPLPGPVRDAQRDLRVYQQTMGLGAGGVLVGGLALSVLGVPDVFWVVVAGLMVVAVLTLFPVEGSARQARRVLAEWAEGTLAPGPREDPRRVAAEALTQRIETVAGKDAASTRAAHSLLQILYDAEEDLTAIAALRAVEKARPRRGFREGHEEDAEAHAPSEPSVPREARPSRSDALEAQVEGRVEAALDALSGLFEGVLGEDPSRLEATLERARGELLRLSAAAEVESLTPSRGDWPPREG